MASVTESKSGDWEETFNPPNRISARAQNAPPPFTTLSFMQATRESPLLLGFPGKLQEP